MSILMNELKRKKPALDDRGMGTLEIVILIAILLAIALIFNEQIHSFSSRLFKAVFDDNRVISKIQTK